MTKIFLFILIFASFHIFCMEDKEWYDYLVDQCRIVQVPLDVVKAILMNENPELNPSAISKQNENGSYDLGLFQLNDKYLYIDFVSSYWNCAELFEWDNPYHNIYVAVRHIQWLYMLFRTQPTLQSRAYSIAMAYNCGCTAVMQGKVPASSVRYAVAVVDYVWGWKNENND